MLAYLPIMGIPNFEQLQVWAKIVQVPVRPKCNLTMMLDTCCNASRSKGATDIDVVARCQRQKTERADLGLLGFTTVKQQHIAAGEALHEAGVTKPLVEANGLGIVFSILSATTRAFLLGDYPFNRLRTIELFAHVGRIERG